jgi:hypothetical protein
MRRCPHEEMCVNVNNDICEFYRLDEIKERLDIVAESKNTNNNVLAMEILS